MADVFAVRRAILRSPWRPTTKNLAILILDLQGLQERACTLSLPGLANALGCGRTAVTEALDELRGWEVLVTKSTGQGRKALRRLDTATILQRWGWEAQPVRQGGRVEPAKASVRADAPPSVRADAPVRQGGRVGGGAGVRQGGRKEDLEEITHVGARTREGPDDPEIDGPDAHAHDGEFYRAKVAEIGARGVELAIDAPPAARAARAARPPARAAPAEPRRGARESDVVLVPNAGALPTGTADA